MEKEVWKDIEGYEGLYQVSNLGRIKSLKRNTNNQCCKEDIILKLKLHKNGYYCVVLYNNGKSKEILVHRLVAQTFLTNTNNLLCVNHINGNKQDNRVENLEWCSFSHNTKEAFRLGLMKPNIEALKKGRDKLAIKVLQIDKHTNEVIREWNSMNEAQKKLKIKTHIYEVISGKRKTAGGFKWKIKEEC